MAKTVPVITDFEYENTDAEYLRNLAERIFQIPVMYGTDQGDTDRLLQIAQRIQNDQIGNP